MNAPDIEPDNQSVLLFEKENGIATITLNCPDRGNSLNPDILAGLPKLWAEIDADDDIRVAIITAAGDRHFCTGADVSALDVGVGGLQNQPYAVANQFSPRMAHLRKPVICAVNGLVNGGGLHFVSDCDIVIAHKGCFFMDSHASVGQVSGLESQGIARRAGIGSALLLALTGKSYRMTAERAFTLGMIDMLEEDAAAVQARAVEIATMIAANSPQAVALSKRAIWATDQMPEPVSSEYGWELLKSHWSHPDFAEGPAAFGERRTPSWNIDPNARR